MIVSDEYNKNKTCSSCKSVDVCERCPQNREGGCGHYGDCHTGGLMSRIDQETLDDLVDKTFPKETIVSTEEPITTVVLVTGINNVNKIVNLAEKNNKSSIDYIPEDSNEPALEILKLMCRSEFDEQLLNAMIDAAEISEFDGDVCFSERIEQFAREYDKVREPFPVNNRATRRSKGKMQESSKWKRSNMKRRFYE